jgi:hypothetical protein
MKKKYRKLWDRMIEQTQSRVLVKLMTEFNLTSTVAIKQNWIWGGKVPKDKESKVLEIFERELNFQDEKTKEIIVNQ